ncbi:MAG: hypothetical protein DRQ35_02660 [Gammaproteobacteria bacterium]|nr:MAG: hypothetical protein DRQ35_02660 [Gammaproteobacteria bacterium]
MITNDHDLPLSIAIWLLHDEYDYNPDPNVISVTGLLKPVKSIILSRRTPTTPEMDLMDLVPSRTGTALHTAVERAWDSPKFEEGLKKMGYSDDVIQRMVINPLMLEEGDLPIYMEQRAEAQFGKYKISGKFDFVLDGVIEDFKSTSVWAWIFQSNVQKFIEQGSIYRYLNQDKITEDYMNITYIFTDWSKSSATQKKEYPQSRIKQQKLQLMSIQETEQFIKDKLRIIDNLATADQAQLPDCTKEELWQSDSVWKYYKDPNKTTRSTKNFDNAAGAYARLSTDGNVGSVIEVKGQVKACGYCNVASICLQREALELAGVLAP